MNLSRATALALLAAMLLAGQAAATGGQYYEGGYLEAQEDPCEGRGGVDGPPTEGTTVILDGEWMHLLTWTCRNGDAVEQWVSLGLVSEYVPDAPGVPPPAECEEGFYDDAGYHEQVCP